MRSSQAKVLHTIAQRPMLDHVLAAAASLAPEAVHVVYGHGGDAVRAALAHRQVSWVHQREQLGTGHAVAQAMPDIPDNALVLILYGDIPLLDSATIKSLCEAAGHDRLGLVTASLGDPSGYGRIQRNDAGQVVGIVEHKDASAQQLEIREWNTGLIALGAEALRNFLGQLDNSNAQAEYYLTDVIGLAAQAGISIETVSPRCLEEVLGVNDRVQLAYLERCYQQRHSEALMRMGATLADPARVDVRGEVSVGEDVFIDINVIFEGRVVLGDSVRIGANNWLRDCEIGSGTEIFANCMIDSARVGDAARIGPFSRLRPGAQVGPQAHIGNFVEIKNTTLGKGSKANHLSYLGDSEIGDSVNVGAGTITCNYDGANKHRTVIGDGAFIGSGVELVAPVTVHSGATIGAGSTISKDAPAEKLTLERAKQMTLPGWKRPKKG